METITIPVGVRAANGAQGTDAWIRRGELSLGERIRGALLLFGGGLVIGAVLLPIPLIHLVGVFVALTGIFLAISRLRRKFVVAAAGGVCPRCGHEGRFFSGLGRSTFDFPVAVSCGSCGIGLTLYQS